MGSSSFVKCLLTVCRRNYAQDLKQWQLHLWLCFCFGISLSTSWTRLKTSILINRVATCQGNVREKQNFLQVREKSGNFEKMSRNLVHLTHVRELSRNFVMSCQGIVREFCYGIFLDWNYYHIIRDLPGLCLCKCLLGKYKLKAYWLLLLSCCLWRYVVGLPLITIKWVLLTLKNKINYQGKMLFCQGILNRLKCCNPDKTTTNSMVKVRLLYQSRTQVFQFTSLLYWVIHHSNRMESTTQFFIHCTFFEQLVYLLDGN